MTRRPSAAHSGRRTPPPRTLGALLVGRDNALGALRLLLAGLVLVDHAVQLGGYGPGLLYDASKEGVTLGTLAVYGFFALSGLLVTASAERLSWRRYLQHRAARLLPGFWVCLLVTALVMAPLAHLHETGSLRDVPSPLPFLVANWGLGIQDYSIGQTLADNPYPRAWNGPHWSLVYEALAYALLSVLAAAGLLRRRRVVLAVTAGLFGYCLNEHLRGYDYIIDIWHLPVLGWLEREQLITLLLAFLIGSCFHLYRDALPVSLPLLAGAACGLPASVVLGGHRSAGVLCLAYLLTAAAVLLPGRVRRIGRSRDLSYGLYIYGFQTQQLVAMVGGHRWGLAAYLALTALPLTALAWLSWTLVEAPALRRKDWGTTAPGLPELPRQRTGEPERAAGSSGPVSPGPGTAARPGSPRRPAR